MPTKIDSLEIEIQSNSGVAAQSISGVARALGELKTSGKVTTAINNLNSLSKALGTFSSAYSASMTISSVARALGELSNLGRVPNYGSMLEKLGNGLKMLEGANVHNLDAKFRAIASAATALSGLKAGGVSTMINSLAKIGKVTAELDNKKIKDFADRIKKLNEVLEPLSTKMMSIQGGLKAMNSQFKHSANGAKELGTKVNATTLNMASMVTVVHGAVAALTPLVRVLSNAISQAIEWDGISARFGRGFGENASDVYSWMQRLNDEMEINIQQFMQYSSTYATMLKGFGIAQADASKMALGYTELTYDIWAGYNDIYKSYADAADAVRSAIAGEVEPIRRAGFTIVESQLEQTAANHGLTISLEKATEAQKSYLRYLTLVDQAQSQNLVGSYAREMNTAEGVMRTFSQQVKSLAQAFGSLFLPVLVEIMPYIQAFIELVSKAVHWLAALFGFKLQSVDFSGYGSGVEDIGGAASDAAESFDDTANAVGGASKALKELKNATTGIDELNIISPPDKSSGGGGGGGAIEDIPETEFGGFDVDSLWDTSIFDNIRSEIDSLSEKLESWLPVIGLVSGALGALALTKLLGDMGAALSQMSVLNKSLASIAMVTIEAALVFSFADNYLEGGSILNLVGEAAATGIGSYLLYKTWGDKGLILGIGVSIAAQLAAITMNLADGGVEITDPEVWIQSAFTTALAGIGAGYLAYKGIIKTSTGKGVSLGLTAGLSVSLSAISIGVVASDGKITKESIFTALGSIVSAAGFGFQVGGAKGALIAAGVMLAVNIIGAIVAVITKGAENDLQESIQERFGSVELSVKDLRVIVDSLSPVWKDRLQVVVEAYADLQSLENKMDSTVKQLNALDWKVSVGMKLTENDVVTYQQEIENFVSQCQEYVKDRNFALQLGLSYTSAPKEVRESAIEIYRYAESTLVELGTDLQNTVNAAFEDGLLDIDETKAIETIRSEMIAIKNALSQSEIEAELSMVELKWSGTELTAESYSMMMEDWNTVLHDEVKPALESAVEENLKNLQANVAFAKMMLERDPNDTTAKQLLADAEAALQLYMDQNPLENMTIEANIRAVELGLNTINEAFAEEIAKAQASGFLDFESARTATITFLPDIVFDDGEGDVYGNIEYLVSNMAYELDTASTTLSKEARKTLEGMLDALKPTMSDFESVAKENRKMGKNVPESVRSGLNDYNQLKALAGDVAGINYLIGKGFSTDPTFLNTLATVEGAGALIDDSVAEGLLNNINYVRDSATGVITGIKWGVNGETVAITPELVENMRILGVNLSEGLADGAASEMQNSKKKWYEWAIWPWNWFKEKNEIHSPSKLFQRGGEYIVQGLVNGLSVNSLRDRLSTIWSKAKTWWNTSKGELKTYTPSIGSVRDKLSSAWNTAKTWWNGSKGALSTYTPTIGSIKNVLENAWNAAKNWWNKNVKLSIPSLSFKVTYSTSDLGTVKKAIVNALGLPGWPKLSFAANGGIFDAGSLIWAGERGAEVVANAAGGKTGVMNVEQMSDAVYEGVYAAVVAAMRSNGGNGGQAVNVYLDGKQITAAVEQRQRERGATIMGSQVYSY